MELFSRALGLGAFNQVVCACGTGRGSLVFAWGGSRVAIRRSGVQSRVDSSGRQRWRSSSARKGEEGVADAVGRLCVLVELAEEV